MDDTRVKARIAGRETAKELLGLLTWQEGAGADYADALLEELRKQLPVRQPPSTNSSLPSPLTPIGRLGQMQVPFGIYRSKSFDEVPLGYLDGLCREQESFYKTLRAYLLHHDLESRRRGIGD